MFEGGEISVYYDPMIAKLSTHAPTRAEAVTAMAAALDRFEISGIANNLQFLTAIMHHPRFEDGRLTTGFIAEEYPDGFHGAPLSPGDANGFIAAAVAAKILRTQRAGRISGALNGGHKHPGNFTVSLNGDNHAVTEADLEVGSLHLVIDGAAMEGVVDWFPGRTLLTLKTAGGEDHFPDHARGRRLLPVPGRARAAGDGAPAPGGGTGGADALKPPPDTSRMLLCPMPGLVVALPVQEGQAVKAGRSWRWSRR